jgi:hypothetical protein
MFISSVVVIMTELAASLLKVEAWFGMASVGLFLSVSLINKTASTSTSPRSGL